MSNICEQCGGMKICTCPLPKEKHDGKLSRGVRGWLDSEVPFDDGSVHLGNDWGGGISLMASEALSLFAWLKQEQDTLERLAQEEISNA